MAQVYRADHVGSLLRPDEVKQARGAFAAGNLSREQLSEAEDRSILHALEGWRGGRDKAVNLYLQACPPFATTLAPYWYHCGSA